MFVSDVRIYSWTGNWLVYRRIAGMLAKLALLFLLVSVFHFFLLLNSLYPLLQARRGLATMHSDLHSGLEAIGLAAKEVDRVRSQVSGVHSEVIGVRSDVVKVRSEVLEVRSEITGVKHDLASVRKTLNESRNESKEYFARFTESLEATQRGIDIMLVRTFVYS